MHFPQVIIIIPNWNGKDMLNECLNSLYDLTDYPAFSVVVVDNGSSDGSVKLIREEFPETDIIENSNNQGFSKANNQGFIHALDHNSEYVVMLNNDIIIKDPNWLETLIDTAQAKNDIGVVSCRILNPDGSVEYNGRYFPRELFLSKRLRERYQYNIYECENTDDRFSYVD